MTKMSIAGVIDLPETATKLESTKPRTKQTGTDAIGSRVVVVCPYPKFNEFFQSEIPKIVRGALTEIIQEAEIDTPPYINVDEREQNAPKPYFIIDFGSVLHRVSGCWLEQARRNCLMSAAGKFFTDYDKEVLALKDESTLFKSKDSKKGAVAAADAVTRMLNVYLHEKLPTLWKTVDEMQKPDEVITIAGCSAYGDYATRNKIRCLQPSASTLVSLFKARVNDKGGGFIPDSVKPEDYADVIKEDVKGMVYHGKKYGLFFRIAE
ncbi:hypothetical protein HY486_04290 [Candidatus Woesearchaeota archaeon]|nr:hypothetical protein [Candidatus Woesearchaeota archaeon]